MIPSAPGRRHSKDHKITDLLYMCHQLSIHELNFDEVFSIVENRYKGICTDLSIDIDIESILYDIKKKIKTKYLPSPISLLIV